MGVQVGAQVGEQEGVCTSRNTSRRGVYVGE